jgi:lysozyme
VALWSALAACGSSVPTNNGHLGLSSSSAVKTCASGATVSGIDVSHYQASVNWSGVASAGAGFAIAKATESTGTTDAQFATNWAGIQQAGLIRGAYHFFHASQDGAQQADFFLSVIGQPQAGDLLPTVDVEIMDSQSAATVIQQLAAFTNEFSSRTGVNPMIYTSPGFWAGIGAPSQFSGNQLWISNYGVSCPGVPAPWSGWQIWQSSGNGSFGGVSTPVDLDTFNGSASDLQAFTVGGGGGCVAAGAACASGQTCCNMGDNCTNGVCCAADGSQPDNGDPASCCSGNGVDANGNCAPACVATGAGCSQGQSCCSSSQSCNGSCCTPDGTAPDNGDATSCCSENGLDGSGNCAPPCVATGAACGQGQSCCSTSQTCSNTCCTPDGTVPDNGDATSCCSQNGLDGSGDCAPSCVASGASCSGQVCCSAVEDCATTCCTPNGAAPDNGDATSCCSGLGVDGTGACLSCLPAGAACTDATDCCNGGDSCTSVCCAPSGSPPDNGDLSTCCDGLGLDGDGNCL